ncbi:MAG: DedA family protein [Deltaproteobacteria bacterium]|nr:DedA family protein [Deltaproteobacteria bacterium]
MVEQLISQYGYLAIFLGTFLEGETILVLGGFAAHRGLLALPGVMLAAFLGSVASDQLFFFIGRRHGSAWLAKRPGWQANVDRVKRLIEHHDTLIILSFRFIYGVRNVTPLVLGMSPVPTWKFAALNTLGAAVWAVAVGALGWFVGSAAKQMLGHLERYELRVVAVIVVVGLALWAHRRFSEHRAAGSAGGSP